MSSVQLSVKAKRKVIKRLGQDFARNKYVYLMVIPVLVFYILFKYGPMTKMIIAFQDYNLYKGIAGSKWVGLENFIDFFQMKDCWRLLRNTLLLSLYSIVFAFPAPILLALMINEIKSRAGRKLVQTVSYMPHFISLVVVCGMTLEFTKSDGVVNSVIKALGGERIAFFTDPSWFRPIYTITDIWQGIGWGSIIYIAALSGIDPQLYEAATIDGAGRLRKMLHVTLPGISGMIVVLFILRLGQVMSVGFEKIILLYNPMLYDTADVISTYVYRKGLMEFSYSYSAAVNMFNSVINFAILVLANAISRRATGNSLW